MLIRNADRDWNHRLGSEITPAAVYHARRDWMRQVAAGAAGLGLAAWAARDARAYDPATLAHLVAVCDAVLRSAKQSGAPRTLFDAAIVRMALAARFAPVAEAVSGAGAPGSTEPTAKKASRPG